MIKSDLKKLHKVFKEHPEGRWICGFDDFERLNKLIKKMGSDIEILELGTGIGAMTSVMAYSNKGRIDTVEQFQKCIDIAKTLIPEELQKNIYFHYSETEPMTISTIPLQAFLHYKELPLGDWDLIVVDGPGPILKDGCLIKLPGGDFVELFKRTKPGTLFYIDGRHEMFKLMERFFKQYFRIMELDKTYALLQRTDKIDDPLRTIDLLQIGMGKAGYYE